MDNTILISGIAWCALACIWLLALDASTKVRWMHRLHALAPVLVLSAYTALPSTSPWPSLLVDWMFAGAAIVALLTVVWLGTLATKNSGVMDVFYTVTAVVPAIALLVNHGTYAPPALLLLALMAVWSARLVRHAGATNLGERGEQQPYASWRVRYGARWWWWSYFQVFLLQGGLVWIWILPIVLALNAAPTSLTATEAVATLVWITGFLFQSIADRQLARFKADPRNKGRVLRTGLWSLTRHPNYFGESLMWWGYFGFGLAHPLGWIGIVGPIYVTWFMSKGSAATMLDRHMLRTKPDYADYVQRVPGFCPFYKSAGDALLLDWAGRRSRPAEANPP